MPKLTEKQYNLVIALTQYTAHRVREQIAYELQEQTRSSDGDEWLESIDNDIRDIWTELNQGDES